MKVNYELPVTLLSDEATFSFFFIMSSNFIIDIQMHILIYAKLTQDGDIPSFADQINPVNKCDKINIIKDSPMEKALIFCTRVLISCFAE